MQPLSLPGVGRDYRDRITVQDYTSKPPIAGVEFLSLRQMVDDGGEFMELARVNDKGELAAKPGFVPTQMNYSRVVPGAVKAFHLHFGQEDVWFVPPTDRLLMGLVDVREGSPTYQQHMRFVLGAGTTRMVYVPRGVAHGVANLWTETAQIIYFVNQQFSLDDPDERRLPWDICGTDFWNIQPG